MKHENIIRGLVVVAFGVLFWILNFMHNKRDKHLKQHLGMSTGYIYGITTSKGDVTFSYTFNIGYKEYQGGTIIGDLADHHSIMHRFFPVVYDSTDIDINDILVRPSDFERFGIPFPDSLEWVKQIY